jgi:hypothetical protein
MYSVLDFTSSQTNDLHRLCKDQYLSKIRRNEDTSVTQRRRRKHQCIFSICLFHQYFINFIHQTLLATVDTMCFGVKFTKEMKYIKMFTIFFMKKNQLLLSKQTKSKKKTHQIYIFILLFQYFINFIPPTLLATVQTKCSGKQ